MSAAPSIGRPRTRAEVAAFLQVSEKTIQRRVKSGKLRAVQDGRIQRFTDEQILEYLEGAVIPGAAADEPRPARNPKKYPSPGQRAQ